MKREFTRPKSSSFLDVTFFISHLLNLFHQILQVFHRTVYAAHNIIVGKNAYLFRTSDGVQFSEQVVLVNGRVFQSVESSRDAGPGDHAGLVRAKFII